ncbi:unnamed protein product, partial [Ectocarpus sp. 4 AP-2014]
GNNACSSNKSSRCRGTLRNGRFFHAVCRGCEAKNRAEEAAGSYGACSVRWAIAAAAWIYGIAKKNVCSSGGCSLVAPRGRTTHDLTQGEAKKTET